MTRDEINTAMAKMVTPEGWTICIKMLIPKKTHSWNGREVDYDRGCFKDSGVAIPKEVLVQLRAQEQSANVYAEVMKKGSLCYKRMRVDEIDKHWCEIGDYIMIARYGGSLVYTPNRAETDIRIINDEDVLCRLDKKLYNKLEA